MVTAGNYCFYAQAGLLLFLFFTATNNIIKCQKCTEKHCLKIININKNLPNIIYHIN
jgi:hypothetical protein